MFVCCSPVTPLPSVMVGKQPLTRADTTRTGRPGVPQVGRSRTQFLLNNLVSLVPSWWGQSGPNPTPHVSPLQNDRRQQRVGLEQSKA